LLIGENLSSDHLKSGKWNIMEPYLQVQRKLVSGLNP